MVPFNDITVLRVKKNREEGGGGCVEEGKNPLEPFVVDKKGWIDEP